MNEQVVSTNGRATRAIVRVRDKRIGESAEEKAVNPRGSSCAFHCESRAHNLARFMANPSSREPTSEATCVVRLRDTSARNSPFPRYTAHGSSRGMLHAGVMRARVIGNIRNAILRWHFYDKTETSRASFKIQWLSNNLNGNRCSCANVRNLFIAIIGNSNAYLENNEISFRMR
jgi:hypothetical protein